MRLWGVIGAFTLSCMMTGCALETIASMPIEPEEAQEGLLEAEVRKQPLKEEEGPPRGAQRPTEVIEPEEVYETQEKVAVDAAEEVPEESQEDSGESPDSDDGEEPAGDGSGDTEEDGGEVLEESDNVAPVNAAQHLWGVCTITFYCPCSECCGSWAGCATASGTTPTAGRTVAADLPFGTRLLIDGQEYVVEDRGVGGMWVDIFVNDHNEALQRGMYQTEVYIIE